MKKWLIFGGGVLTGRVLTFLFFLAVAAFQRHGGNGVTYFEKPGEKIEGKSFEVFQVQVLEPGAALVRDQSDLSDLYLGPVYLITNDEGKYYYNGEVVKVPDGKVVRQVGIYKYPTKNDFEKTVPIIQILDK